MVLNIYIHILYTHSEYSEVVHRCGRVSTFVWCAYDQVERLHRQWNGIDSWLNSYRTFSPPIVHRKKIWYDLYRSNTNSFYYYYYFFVQNDVVARRYTHEGGISLIYTRVYVSLERIKNKCTPGMRVCYIINNLLFVSEYTLLALFIIGTSTKILFQIM